MSRLPLILSLLLPLSAAAATEVLQVGQALPRIGMLKDGTHHYLRYTKQGEANTLIDIWTREIKAEGENLRIRQRWDGQNSLRTLDSRFVLPSFRPLSHDRISEKDGNRKEEHFRFEGTQVSDAEGKAVAAPEGTYNFETDIEFLQALPLGPDYAASIMFYHPGGAAPARYLFRVTGEQVINGPGGPVPCWVVETDYNKPGYKSTFWFAKATQLMVRQESPMPDGKVLIKTLID